ncbi:MAG: tetratricopeptide repeat protein [Alphaproteobacteria bacterium]
MAGDAVAAPAPTTWRQPIQDLIASGDFDGAIARCRALRSAGGPKVELDYFEGLACVGAGRSTAAIVALAEVLKAQPGHVGALCALGTALQGAGRFPEAIDYLELATRLHPNAVGGWVALGGVFLALGRNAEAEAAFADALERVPDHAGALAGLGTAAQRQLRYGAAEAALRRALVVDPDNAMVRGNLGALLTDTARQAEAQAMLAEAVRLRPDDPVLISNRLFASLYDEAASAESIVALHRELGAQVHGMAPRGTVAASAPSRDPERLLRIGYLSPDFRRHPVGFFLHDVLPAHDRDQVRVIAFHDSDRRDWMTERLNAGADDWHEVAGLGTPALAALVARCEVDVLVDLAGHTQNNRLPLFAGRAAPVQLSWAGYPGTTGVPEMDGVLVDRYLAAAAAPGDYSEALIGALPVYACYAPPDYAPMISHRPEGAPLTFGCFANAAKINRTTAALWARVTARVAGSRLLIKTHACADASTRDRLAALLVEAGIAADALCLEGPSPHDVLLGRMSDVDIILDCVPYSGSTTVMEALWMGVPVVSLAGRLYHQRHGGAVLHAAGMDDLVAETGNGYVDTAVALAHDAGRRRRLRAGLRRMMERSPLRDGSGMARALETIYRRLWRRWCQQITNEGP